VTDWANIKYFKPDEFTCKCGCGLQRIDPKLVYILDTVRKEVGFPLTVNSGTRCLTHNAAVGGVGSSAHTVRSDGFSKAADISIRTSGQRYLFLKAALQHVARIVIYNEFVHVDVDQLKPQRVVALGKEG
jgi:hypothetical protein